MKKKLLVAVLTVAMLLSFTGCGEKQDDKADKADTKGEFVLKDADLKEYITLNEDYDKFDLEIDSIEVTDDQIHSQINNLILDNITSLENLQTRLDRVIVEGDTVNIDYVGTKDGVAFDGGTSQGGTNLTIGSNSYIDGFEDGLIGKKPGEVVTLDLTFPENYEQNTDLAGQAVQFEVTIHYIVPTYLDIVDDDAANLYEGMKTIEELKATVSKDIYDSLYENAVEYAVIDAIETKCTYAETLPQSLLDDSYNNIMTNLETYASYYGMDLETYIYLSYYQDLETFQNETANELAQYNTKYLLFCQAFANEKDLNITDEELETQLQSYVNYYGYESIEAGFTEAEKESIRNSMMNMKVLDYLIENANVTMKAADDTEAAE